MRRKIVLVNLLLLGVSFGFGNTFRLLPVAAAQTLNRSARRTTESVKRVNVTADHTALLRARARAYEPYILQAARRHAVDPRLLWAIAFLETRFRPGLVSPKGARGMMQFMPGTATRFRLLNPHDAVAAIETAARYVRLLSAQFGGRPALVLAAYNAGEGTVEAYLKGIRLRRGRNGSVINPLGRKTGGIPPYAETQRYVSQGLRVMQWVGRSDVFSTADLAPCRVPVTRGAPQESVAAETLLNSNQTAVETVVEPHPAPASIYANNVNGTGTSVFTMRGTVAADSFPSAEAAGPSDDAPSSRSNALQESEERAASFDAIQPVAPLIPVSSYAAGSRASRP